MNKNTEMRREKAKQTRYRRSALDGYEAEFLESRLSEISEECDNIRYLIETDNSILLDALDGDEEEALEFRMLFHELSVDAERLLEVIFQDFDYQLFNDCTVAALGGMLKVVGFDSFERDYYNLTGYEETLAQGESTKRLMAMTKASIVESFHKTWRIFTSFWDLEQRYENLKATMDIIRGDNAEVLNSVRGIENAYEEMYAEYDGSSWSVDREAERKLDRLISGLPDRCFVE